MPFKTYSQRIWDWHVHVARFKTGQQRSSVQHRKLLNVMLTTDTRKEFEKNRYMHMDH